MLRSDLYAVAALAGAAIVVIGDMFGLSYGVSALARGVLCFGLRFRQSDTVGGCLWHICPREDGPQQTLQTRKTLPDLVGGRPRAG